MEFQGTVFQFTSLPFDISKAPWLLTKIAEVMKDLFRRDGLTLFQYLVNWLGDAQFRLETQARCNLLVRLCSYLGFLINYEKSELIPTLWAFISM